MAKRLLKIWIQAVRNADKVNGSTDNGEIYKISSPVYSGDGYDEDVTVEIKEEISPAFGIMLIYCRSELHYSVTFLGHFAKLELITR